jgi:hypothetical protein
VIFSGISLLPDRSVVGGSSYPAPLDRPQARRSPDPRSKLRQQNTSSAAY